MKKNKRLLALLLALCMIMALMAGCGSSSSTTDTSSAADTASEEESVAEEPEEEPEEEAEEEEAPAEEPEEAPAEEPEEAPAEEPEEAPEEEPEEEEASDTSIVRVYNQAESLPLTTEDITLTAWDYVVPPVMSAIDDYGVDGQVYATLQEITGIKLKFTTANLLTANDSMSLMVAANEMPDIIFNFGMFYSSSMDDLVDADIIVDYVEHRDMMPNYFDILDNNPSIARDVYTENGSVVLAANIFDTVIPSSGPTIRQDWLDADGLDVPVTIDDLYNVLKTFQSENDCQYPMWIAANGNSSLNSAYGVSISGENNNLGGWIYVDGQMEYCVPMDGFRDYIQLITDWYSEGLISPDFVSNNQNNTANVDELTGNGAGFFTSSVNGLTDLSGYEPDTDVEPIHAIVLNEGDLNGFDDAGTSQVSKGGCAVACSCPELDLALQLVDYGYSDDGILLWNYGVEGVSFEYNDAGEPELTELVTNNPDFEFSVALIKYTSSTPASVCINERNYLGYTDAQVNALSLWMRDTDSLQAPGSLWSADAQTEYSTIATDLGSYVTTKCLQFITGADSMDNWDSFIEEMYASFDIDRLAELNQQAVEAYLALGT